VQECGLVVTKTSHHKNNNNANDDAHLASRLIFPGDRHVPVGGQAQLQRSWHRHVPGQRLPGGSLPCLDLNALECLHVSSVCREAVLDLEDFLNTITAQIVAGDQVEIELPCKCMQLLDCPVSCTFANTSRSNELMTTSSPQEEASSIPATLELGPESGCTLPIPGNIRLLIALLLVIVAW
jgi:hypothetical protein